MATIFHLGMPECSGSARQWTMRAGLTRTCGDDPAASVPVADIVFHVDGIRQVPVGLGAFFPHALVSAMRRGAKLVVHGSLPVAWQTSARRFQEIACAWFPELTRVEVEARWETIPGMSGGGGDGLVFSCDLDSFHALGHASATHLIHLVTSARGTGRGKAVHAVAARLGLPVITITQGIQFADPGTDLLAGYPAVDVAAVVHLLAGDLRQVTWGSPHGWLSPPGGGDHFALAECFASGDCRLRVTGRGADRLAKWQALASQPLAREFLHVCGNDPTGVRNCGRCQACWLARLAIHALAAGDAWGEWAAGDAMDDAALASCIAADPDFCRQALELLRQHATGQDLAARLSAAWQRAAIDTWAGKLGVIGGEATASPRWGKFARRLLPQVLATAATHDPAWLRGIAAVQCNPPPP